MNILTHTELRARYQAGTMGYDSCMLYLKRLGYTEKQADDVLLGKDKPWWEEKQTA